MRRLDRWRHIGVVPFRLSGPDVPVDGGGCDVSSPEELVAEGFELGWMVLPVRSDDGVWVAPAVEYAHASKDEARGWVLAVEDQRQGVRAWIESHLEAYLTRAVGRWPSCVIELSAWTDLDGGPRERSLGDGDRGRWS